MRFFSFALVGGFVALAACTGDDSSGGSGNSSTPPSSCPAQPCQVGTQCFQAADGNCNGVWYCWSDATWHCAPPDASAPGGDGGPIIFPEGGQESGSSSGPDGASSGGGDAPSD